MAKAEAECPGIFDFEERWDAAEKKKEEAEETRKSRKGLTSAKWVADMKKTAMERQTEREMTDLRLIQREAETTDHLYKEVDADVAPIITPSYRLKLTEQAHRAKAAAEKEKEEAENAVEQIGFKSFKTAMMKAQAGEVDAEPTEEEDARKELEIYLHQKEAKKKKERRARYLAMKKQQRPDLIAEAEAEEADATPADAAPPPPSHAEPAPAEPADADAAMEGNDEGAGEKAAEGAGEGAAGTEAAEPQATSTKQVIEQLAYVDADRKRIVREQRLSRRRKRNDEDDVDRARDRYLRRKLERMRPKG
eukprot:TRINITY_DN25108_c0_g1_i1.p1 TRINITY_DN25108_c0_g1~~TRINITY_DN25108_c0_g1_i1.p1  ORF type:complete len:337 (+),score=159.58 TRINITY_DN25108_c0_g1_i1:91-1011(+)